MPGAGLAILAALALPVYWLFGLASALEAWFLTGVLLPGALIVEVGGLLVQRGVLDFGALTAFVAAGSVLGSQASFWTARFAARRIAARRDAAAWPAQDRAEELFRRWGGLALVLGRFAGPAAGLVPLVAALSGMGRMRFLFWSVLGGLPFALVHVGIGYGAGEVLTRLGPVLTRVALVFGAMALALGLTGALVWRLVRLVPRILPLGQAVADTLAARPAMRRLRARFPRISRLVAARLAPAEFTGLPLSALLAIFAYVFVIWLDGLFDFLHADPILQLDQRLAELIHVFWTPGLLRLAAHVTALGDGRVVIAVAGAALIGLILRGRSDLAAGLGLALAGNQLSVTLLKALLHRPRPVLAWFAESSNSFPSGHAAVSVAFWGMLAYALWRTGRLSAVLAALAGALIAVAIGSSRLYLIEHFLSDVVNGWLIGALWLMAGVALAEWLRTRRGPARRFRLGRGLRRAAGVAMLALIFAAGWITARYDKALALPPLAAGPRAVASAQALFAAPDRPRRTESLLGAPLEPINLVLLAASSADLNRAMLRAGWTPARLPSPAALADAFWALTVNRPDPNAPVTPYFWDGAPNDLAFERAADAQGPVLRHHVRLWDAGAVLPDGRQLWVAAASFDNGLDRTLLHHIDPDLDAERDRLAADLIGAGAVQAPPLVLSGPAKGTSVAGDPWFSDGRAAVLDLPRFDP